MSKKMKIEGRGSREGETREEEDDENKRDGEKREKEVGVQGRELREIFARTERKESCSCLMTTLYIRISLR